MKEQLLDFYNWYTKGKWPADITADELVDMYLAKDDTAGYEDMVSRVIKKGTMPIHEWVKNVDEYGKKKIGGNLRTALVRQGYDGRLDDGIVTIYKIS